MTSEIILAGFVKVLGEEQTISASLTKRELVISTEEQYPQHILINFLQGKCNNQLDQLQVGEMVSVSVNIKGREWTNPQGETKYFNDIQGWKVSKSTGTHNTAAPAPASPQQAKVFVFTATDFPLEAYRKNNWTDEQLVKAGKGRFETQSAAPAPAPAAAPNPEKDDLPF